MVFHDHILFNSFMHEQVRFSLAKGAYKLSSNNQLIARKGHSVGVSFYPKKSPPLYKINSNTLSAG